MKQLAIYLLINTLSLSMFAMEQRNTCNLVDTLVSFGPTFFSENIVPFIGDEDINNIRLASQKCHQLIRSWCQTRLQWINTTQEHIQNKLAYIPGSLVLDSTNSHAYIFGYKKGSKTNPSWEKRFGLFTYCLPIKDKPIFTELATEMKDGINYKPTNCIKHTLYYLNLVMYHEAKVPTEPIFHANISKNVFFLNKKGQITTEGLWIKPLKESNIPSSFLCIVEPKLGVESRFYPEQKKITYTYYSDLMETNSKKPFKNIYHLFPVFAEDLLQTTPTKEELVSTQEIEGITYYQIEREYNSIPLAWNNEMDTLRSLWKLYHDYNKLIPEKIATASLDTFLKEYSYKQCADMCVIIHRNSTRQTLHNYCYFYEELRNKILQPCCHSDISYYMKKKSEFDSFIKEVKISPHDYSLQEYTKYNTPLPKPTTTQQLVSYFRFNYA
ncbi:MAG TPA: hypothetical protein VGW78_06160 [Candidatus Babeliales bacterium]|jgi:hypothetical protein|nr:hypothetical protein [Candidatus Babeliales bacterium]